MYVYVHYVEVRPKEDKRGLDSLELGLQVVVSRCGGPGESNLGPLEEQ